MLLPLKNGFFFFLELCFNSCLLTNKKYKQITPGALSPASPAVSTSAGSATRSPPPGSPPPAQAPPPPPPPPPPPGYFTAVSSTNSVVNVPASVNLGHQRDLSSYATVPMNPAYGQASNLVTGPIASVGVPNEMRPTLPSNTVLVSNTGRTRGPPMPLQRSDSTRYENSKFL